MRKITILVMAALAGTFETHGYALLNRVDLVCDGTVCRVRSMRHDQVMAAKVVPNVQLDPVAVAQLSIIRSLRHPHVLQINDVVQVGSDTVFISELCEGGSLRSEIDSERRFARARVVETARQMISGLSALHARGISHGDLRPENVWWSDLERRSLRIACFDLPATTNPRCAAYIAPELRGGQTITPAGDVWALGITLIEMLIGRAGVEQIIWESPEEARSALQGLAVGPALTEALGRMLAAPGRRAAVHELALLPVFAWGDPPLRPLSSSWSCRGDSRQGPRVFVRRDSEPSLRRPTIKRPHPAAAAIC